MKTDAQSSPLQSRTFRALWLATIVSNIGTWMHDVGAGWLMTSLSPQPIMVALVQSATTFPMFLLALPAGALADIVDRRRMLIAAQIWIFFGALLLAALGYAGAITAPILLGLTLVVACGAAFSAPAFQATVPELVAKPALVQAIALNSLGINIARAIGPALGGAVIALAGVGAVFAINALSIIGVVVVLVRWQRRARPADLPAERFFGAVRAGLRYARHSPDMKLVIARSAGFFLFASAPWALLPLVAREGLGLGPAGYGGLLALLGAGAVVGALILPAIRRHVSGNFLTVAASILFLAAGSLLGFAHSFTAGGAASAIAGAAWIAVVSSLNAAAQMSAPAWVRARALALFILVFQGSLTVGSVLWGAVATEIGIPSALALAAAGGALVAVVLGQRVPLGGASPPDLAPSMHWPLPASAADRPEDRGPVLVTVVYSVAPERVPAFAAAMAEMRRLRRRDGALAWGLYEDSASPGAMIESFIVESWLEHLRQHNRTTNADRIIENTARAFHTGTGPPLVRHWIAP